MKIFIIHFPARENLLTWIEQTRVLLHSWVWLTFRLIFIHHFHHSHHSNSESFLNKWLTFLRCWQARNMIRVRETNLWQFKTLQPSHSDNCLASWLGTLQRQHSSLLLSISIDSTRLVVVNSLTLDFIYKGRLCDQQAAIRSCWGFHVLITANVVRTLKWKCDMKLHKIFSRVPESSINHALSLRWPVPKAQTGVNLNLK